MYSYSYDALSGGIVLNSSPTVFSKEPRPVYAMEMSYLGFERYWSYDDQNDVPYMWAESNVYWYRGTPIAKTKGGDLNVQPELIPMYEEGHIPFAKDDGFELLPIDIAAMNRQNEEIMDIIEAATVKKIVREYEKFKKRLDIFHVAFSGGKDSIALLDLVKKALPLGSFVVIFGDTGMEFPDTYKVVDDAKKKCEEDGTPFFIARSHLTPSESWSIFGPPARVLRWCCSVHKSTPQTLKMREITGRDDYVGMDFVGVRAHESLTRSKYEYENFGMKQKGQYSFNPILEWTSAEVWLYIFMNDLVINEAYKKGNSRVGCLFCPMGSGISTYFRRRSYEREVDQYVDYIKRSYGSADEKKTMSYILNGGWNARKNGRDLADSPLRYVETTAGDNILITVMNPATDWKEWIQTIGDFQETDSGGVVRYKDKEYSFSVTSTENGYIVSLPLSFSKESPQFAKLFRQVFRKSAYCVKCRVCETNCRYGCIKFNSGNVRIENCIHCHQCHEIDSGCLLFHSLRHPQGGGKTMKSLNSFADHAPKREWLEAFFDLKESFFTEHTLGPMMYDMFRRFLRDAGLNEKNHFTPFAELISKIGWESDVALGLMMVNLAMDNPQIAWYVNSLDIDVQYERKHVEETLTALDVKPKDAKSIIKSYKRIMETPFGTTLNFGYVSEDDVIVRTKWSMSDNRVFLYALYRFVEKCNLSHEFSVAYLMDESIERDAVCPIRLFGLYDEEELRSTLLGLSARYPEYINATFTNDLQSVILRDKSSTDVLKLF